MRTRRSKKKPHTIRLSGKGADDWREVVAAERATLYATPRRCMEIERRQPEPLEYGRPLFYLPDVSARRSRRHHVEEAQSAPIPVWRTTFEFEGDEDALADNGEKLVVAEQDDGLANEQTELAVAPD